MNVKHIKYIAAFAALLVFGAGLESGKGQTTQNIVVVATTNKTPYVLGETVTVRFKVANNSDRAIQIPKLWAGNPVVVSSDGKDYKKTSRGKWEVMLVNIPKVNLNPGESYDYSDIEILYGGHRPDYSHLNPQKASELERKNDRVLTSYAFPYAGEFLIKGNLGSFESEPVKITVSEPIGEDLKVWNRINTADFAYFMQEGNLSQSTYKSENRMDFLSELEKLLTEYPQSLYAEPLRRSLTKFNAAEAKRENLIERANTKPNQ